MDQADAVSLKAGWEFALATDADVGAWAGVRAALWPEGHALSHAAEIRRALEYPHGQLPFW